jgi:hypothetical protein
MKNLMLVFFAVVTSVTSVLYTQSQTLPPPYYGINPDTGLCEEGIILGTCGGTSSTRCAIWVGENPDLVAAFDNLVGTICVTPVFRPN